ncbi:MAG: hypothetical protein RMJ67_01315 [Elusimicrobiota bacterium]|nr:hypothetical protein [Endomicrobiia bacterium]MDW8165143.1 hypothetical protein [Elusimicrobiota bacterium]
MIAKNYLAVNKITGKVSVLKISKIKEYSRVYHLFSIDEESDILVCSAILDNNDRYTFHIKLNYGKKYNISRFLRDYNKNVKTVEFYLLNISGNISILPGMKKIVYVIFPRYYFDNEIEIINGKKLSLDLRFPNITKIVLHSINGKSIKNLYIEYQREISNNKPEIAMSNASAL